MQEMTPVTDEMYVEFSDTDVTTFAHYATIVRYFEKGLRKVLEKANISIDSLATNNLGTPVVSLQCDYLMPIQFGDKLQLHTQVEDVSERSFTLNHKLRDSHTEDVATGTITHVCVNLRTGESEKMPEELFEELEILQGHQS